MKNVDFVSILLILFVGIALLGVVMKIVLAFV